MKNIKVIFRKSRNPYTGKWELEAYFPEFSAKYGYVQLYADCAGGGWCEASTEFYQTTKKAAPDEYLALLDKLRTEFLEDDFYLVVRQRINWNDLRNKAWKRVV